MPGLQTIYDSASSVGRLPGDATQVYMSGSAGGSDETIYTCPAGKVCYITAVNMSVLNNNAAYSNGYINVQTSLGVELFLIIEVYVRASGSGWLSNNFVPAIEVYEGQEVHLGGKDANCLAFANLVAYEMDI